MIGVIIALILFFIVFLIGFGLVVFTNRIVMWNERTFSPALNAIVSKIKGKYYRPRGTPAWWLKTGKWILRVIGVIFIAGSVAVMYFIISNLIHYLD